MDARLGLRFRVPKLCHQTSRKVQTFFFASPTHPIPKPEIDETAMCPFALNRFVFSTFPTAAVRLRVFQFSVAQSKINQIGLIEPNGLGICLPADSGSCRQTPIQLSGLAEEKTEISLVICLWLSSTVGFEENMFFYVEGKQIIRNARFSEPSAPNTLIRAG